MMFPLAQADPAGGGAPLDELALIAGITWTLTALVIWMSVAYRRGGARPLRRLEHAVERLVGLPGWAALPGAGAVLCATVTIIGATWDIGLHIDVGRDEGPLGTLAHYPLLFGLFTSFLMGVLAIGMAPEDPRRASPVAYRLAGVGPVPAAGILLLAGSAFGMIAFPLDDFWHRLFGQDVTLWGPTHTMIIGGTLAAGVGGVLLLVEGARATGRDPFRGRTLLHRPLPALLAGVCLYLWAATTHEFNWGVPQFRQIWHPLLLTFGAAQALIMARLLAGRGGALAALVVWLPLQLGMTLAIGGPLGVTMPAMPLFVGQALVVELLAARRDPANPLAFGAVAGLGIGTVGFAADYGWSHVVMPLPWEPSLLAEAIPVAIVAGLAGGLLSALTAQALTGTLPSGRRPLTIAIAAGVAVVALGVNAADTKNPKDARAAMAITDVRQGATPNHDEPQRVGDVAVRFSDPSIADDANWVYVLGWQGKGRYVNHLVKRADGAWHTTKPVPLDDTWKTMVRVHSGRTMLSAPIRFPADRAIAFRGYAERPQVTRTMVPDTKLMQLERKGDAPMWAWTPATVLVLSTNLLMAIFIGVVCVRLGRLAGAPPTTAPPAGSLVEGADRLTALAGAAT